VARNIPKVDDWAGHIQKIKSLDAGCRDIISLAASQSQVFRIQAMTEKFEKEIVELKALVERSHYDDERIANVVS
jgi:hypothetical protein